MNQIVRNELNASQLQVVADQIIKEATRLGASASEVDISANKGFSVSARDGDVETVSYHQDKNIELTVYFGTRSGVASLSDIREEAVRDAVAAACRIAKFTDEDPAAGLPQKNQLAFDYPQLDLAYPWALTVDKAIELAIQCEREAVSYDKRIMSAEDVAVVTDEALHVHANSLGFVGVVPSTRHEISCVLVAKDNDGMQRDYSYTTSTDPSHLESISSVAKQAADRVIRRLGARSIRTTKTPVIFFAEEARSLIGHFTSAISGGALYRKSSFLLDKLGKKIFPDFMHMQEQPHLPRALGSAPFDNDGVATRPNVFIDNGILQKYSLSVYSARKMGMETTGNAGGIHNLLVRPGNKSLAELLKLMGTGFLVTELMGHGANLVTGDYSRGAGGFWVENGEIQYPVHEVTIAGTLQEIYSRIVEVGNDVDMRGNIRTGSILIEEMMVAGM